jgi:hypothetical protein
MRECFGQFSMFGNGRNDRHEVGFAGAVVAYDKEPFIVGGLVELQLREDYGCEPLGISSEMAYVATSWWASLRSLASRSRMTVSMGSNWIRSPYCIRSALSCLLAAN